MEQFAVFAILALSLVLFIWDKVRYDIVAFLALMALVLLGVIPIENAFSGLAHPAVITVASVLIISKALQHSGLVDIIGDWVGRISNKLWVQVILLSFMVAFASGFINNIGALAVIMPIALHLSYKNNYSPSLILMPLAFASILGGMTTLIGTPPNIIIATFRAEAVGERFGMFDFVPVGVILTVVCLLYVTLIGWRMLPKRRSADAGADLFEIENYLTEVRITEDSTLLGQPISYAHIVSKAEAQLLGIIRNGVHMHAPPPWEEFQEGDTVIVEADADELKKFIANTQVELVKGSEEMRKEAKGAKDIQHMEVIVLPDSPVVDHSASDFKLHTQYFVNLLGLARLNRSINKRVSEMNIKPGDVLLLQGQIPHLKSAIKALRFLPLAKRDISLGKRRRIVGALGIFFAAVFCVMTGLLNVEIAFSLAAVVMVLSNILPIKEVYESIDWPVIILLGFMIPVGEAFETSGAANSITNLILTLGTDRPLWLFGGVLMVVTLVLSDIINNSATVVLMAPIAISIAENLGISPDPMLMIVAVAGSCAFLTPIGHHSSTLVMGPGGYKYSDYWKLGLPLTLVISCLGVPLILYFWG